MQLKGTHVLPVERQQVWQALLDPHVLSRVMPGCERLEREGEDRFSGVLSVHIGPVKGKFVGSLELSDLRPLEGYRLKLNGQGPSGFMNGEGTVTLTDDPAGTALSYDLEAQVGGRIAGVGQRLLDSSAKVIVRQGLEGLERQLNPQVKKGMGEGAGEGVDAAGEPMSSASPPAPSQAEFACRFAVGLYEELVPERQRPWVLAGAAFLLGMLLGRLLAPRR